MAKHIVYPYQSLFDYIVRVFTACAVPEEDAKIAAQVILAADLRGVASHGITRLFSYYADKLRNGTILAQAKLNILQESSATLALDGCNGLGQVIGHKAMQMCINRAKQTGVAFATVRNSNHFGIAGYYAMLALPENMIGICLTNSQPLVAPTYGKKAIIGTNPIAVAIPAGQQRPFVLDMATSVVPIGKIAIYEKAKEDIPAGWGTDNEGKLTTSPSAVRSGGALLPLGGPDILRGYKGYGLAVLVDILSGVLSGSSFGSQVGKITKEKPHGNVGHIFGSIHIEAFRPLVDFFGDMDTLLQEIKESPKAVGQTRIYIHGEKEFERAESCQENGVPLLAETVESLELSGSGIQVPFDLNPLREVDLPL